MKQQVYDNQDSIRLVILIIGIGLLIWSVATVHTSGNTSSSTPGSTVNSTEDLQVEPPSSSSSGNPQQTTSPSQSSSDQVQSGQPNLQPAQGSDQMPDSLKQELGL